MSAWTKIEFENQWDDDESDPLEDIYRAATILSDSYKEKKHWGLKLSKRKRENEKRRPSKK